LPDAPPTMSGIGDGGIGLSGIGIVDGAVGLDLVGRLVEIAVHDLVITVRSAVADGKRRCRSELLLDLEIVREQRGRADRRVHGGGADCRCHAGRVGNCAAAIGVDRVVGCGLVEAVVERIEQGMVQACTSCQAGVSVAKHVPCEADTRLGKKQRMVAGQGIGETGGGRGADDSVGKGVDAGAVLRFAPAVEVSVRKPIRASNVGVMCQVSSRNASAKSVRQPSSVVTGA